ncbi:MAG: hypothetical protein Q4G11_07080, partial [Gallicola sp.]|nr:hypothetical protein [Gallicola sp.]
MSKGIEYVMRVLDYATEPFRKIQSGIAKTSDAFTQMHRKYKKEMDTMPYSLNAIRGKLDNLRNEQGTTTSIRRLREINQEIRKGEKGLKHYENLPPASFLQRVRNASGEFAKLGGMIVAAFSLSSIAAFGKSTIEAASGMEKVRTVLNVQNTGNFTKTASEMRMLSDFAKQNVTNLKELEASFVKLKSQAFEPTKNQIRQLSDLSNASGKSFDQLAEAILDAQTGEFERLKEFGIKASQAGDKVTFNFKGQKTTVEKTEKAMRDYLLR